MNTDPTPAGVSDERAIRGIQDVLDSYLMTAYARESLEDAIRIIRSTRALLREARPALQYLIEDNDAWIECIKKSLLDPNFGIAVSNYEQFISEERADLALRQNHAIKLRALISIDAKGSRMCKCTPSIKTPYCGAPGCEWPKPEGARVPSPTEQGREAVKRYAVEHDHAYQLAEGMRGTVDDTQDIYVLAADYDALLAERDKAMDWLRILLQPHSATDIDKAAAFIAALAPVSDEGGEKP